MTELELLAEKVNLLLKKYAALQAENKSLKKALAKGEQELNSLKDRLNAEAQEQVAKSISNALTDKKERITARKQLDAVIGEIDKILMNLND